jgi:type IV secretory pathway TrbF-like protein
MESNPYLEARREWDERYADLVLGKRNWQIAAGGLMLLSLILASDIVWLGNHSRYIPYVVEVDMLRYALTMAQPLTPVALSDVTGRMERYEVAAFIREARSVTSDPQVERPACQRGEETLAHGVVEAVAHGSHQRPHPGRLAAFAERERGILGAVVGRMDCRGRPASKF